MMNDFIAGAHGLQERLARYCGQSKEALKQDVFTYFALSDLINLQGPGSIAAGCASYATVPMTLDIPLEINFWYWR